METLHFPTAFLMTKKTHRRIIQGCAYKGEDVRVLDSAENRYLPAMVASAWLLFASLFFRMLHRLFAAFLAIVFFWITLWIILESVWNFETIILFSAINNCTCVSTCTACPPPICCRKPWRDTWSKKINDQPWPASVNSISPNEMSFSTASWGAQVL